MDDGFEVMVTRVLEVDGEPNFLIEVGKPYEGTNGNWFCPYRLTGPETRHMQRMGGVDGMQALINVLYVLNAVTEVAVENRQGRLTWCEQREHFGFPSPEADPALMEIRRRQGR